jgi:hypothetical protein
VDDAIDIVANRLSLQAAGNIGEIELAVNQFTSVLLTGGSIDLTDRDGEGESSVGLAHHPCGGPAGLAEDRVCGEGWWCGGRPRCGPNGVVQLASLTDSVVIENTSGVPKAIESSIVAVESPVIVIDCGCCAGRHRYKAAGTVTSPTAGSTTA